MGPGENRQCLALATTSGEDITGSGCSASGEVASAGKQGPELTELKVLSLLKVFPLATRAGSSSRAERGVTGRLVNQTAGSLLYPIHNVQSFSPLTTYPPRVLRIYKGVKDPVA